LQAVSGDDAIAHGNSPPGETDGQVKKILPSKLSSFLYALRKRAGETVMQYQNSRGFYLWVGEVDDSRDAFRPIVGETSPLRSNPLNERNGLMQNT
jgi:hypothetical protein